MSSSSSNGLYPIVGAIGNPFAIYAAIGRMAPAPSASESEEETVEVERMPPASAQPIAVILGGDRVVLSDDVTVKDLRVQVAVWRRCRESAVLLSFGGVPLDDDSIPVVDIDGMEDGDPDGRHPELDPVIDVSIQERVWLKSYETAPCIFLNPYGFSKEFRLADQDMWELMGKPQPQGSRYMTEFCSHDPGWRGVAIYRFLKALVDFLSFQISKPGLKMNQFVMKPDLLCELMDEIEGLLPSVKYCLACPHFPEGSRLRLLHTDALLDEHGKVVYDFLDITKPSRVRMMIQYQGAAGLSFNAQCHLRCAQCFRYVGGKHGGVSGCEISLSEWQEAIKIRHSAGSAGIGANGDGDCLSR